MKHFYLVHQTSSTTMDVDAITEFTAVTRDDGSVHTRYAAILRKILFEKTTRVVCPQLQLYRTLFGIAPSLFELDKPFYQDSAEDKLKFAVRVRVMPDPAAPAAPAAAAAPAAPAASTTPMPALGGAAPAASAAPSTETYHKIIFVGFWNGTEFIPVTMERDNIVAGQARVTIANF